MATKKGHTFYGNQYVDKNIPNRITGAVVFSPAAQAKIASAKKLNEQTVRVKAETAKLRELVGDKWVMTSAIQDKNADVKEGKRVLADLNKKALNRQKVAGTWGAAAGLAISTAATFVTGKPGAALVTMPVGYVYGRYQEKKKIAGERTVLEDKISKDAYESWKLGKQVYYKNQEISAQRAKVLKMASQLQTAAQTLKPIK